MSAVDSAMPSTTPTTSAEAPSPVTMNTGSRLWTSSEETSMSRLTKPSTQTPAGMRVAPVAAEAVIMRVLLPRVFPRAGNGHAEG